MGEVSISSLPNDIINSHILNLLDPQTLFSLASSSSDLHHLSTQNHLWHTLCSSMWPCLNDPLLSSLFNSHFSFFSDSFPSPSITINHHPPSSPPPSHLFSAVDLYYNGIPFFSKVHVTHTRKSWFPSSPLWIDLLQPNEVVPTNFKFGPHDDVEWLKHLEDNFTLSWIIIDPIQQRSANLSSRRVVSTQCHRLTEELEVVFAIMLEEEVQCSVKVTCCGKTGGEMHVREVSLTMEDMDGRHVIGKDSIVILQRAMENGKRKTLDRKKAIESYDKFSEMRKERLMMMKRRHNKIDDSMFMLVAFTLFSLLLWFLWSCLY